MEINKEPEGSLMDGIEDRVAEAIKDPDSYELEDLQKIWNVLDAKIKQEKAKEKEGVRKQKLIRKMEKAIDKNHIPDWKTNLYVLEKKIKERMNNLRDKMSKK